MPLYQTIFILPITSNVCTYPNAFLIIYFTRNFHTHTVGMRKTYKYQRIANRELFINFVKIYRQRKDYFGEKEVKIPFFVCSIALLFFLIFISQKSWGKESFDSGISNTIFSNKGVFTSVYSGFVKKQAFGNIEMTFVQMLNRSAFLWAYLVLVPGLGSH